MRRTSRFVLSGVLLTLFVAFTATPWQGQCKEKKIRWVPITYKQFMVDDLAGSLTSCVYRTCPDGKSEVFIHEDKVKIEATKSEAEEVRLRVLVNKEHIKNLSAEMVRASFEDAIQQCYEKLTE